MKQNKYFQSPNNNNKLKKEKFMNNNLENIGSITSTDQS